MWSDSRFFADDRYIDVNDTTACLMHERRGMTQEQVRGRVAPFRIARREVHADITGAERTEDRIGQRM